MQASNGILGKPQELGKGTTAVTHLSYSFHNLKICQAC